MDSGIDIRIFSLSRAPIARHGCCFFEVQPEHWSTGTIPAGNFRPSDVEARCLITEPCQYFCGLITPQDIARIQMPTIGWLLNQGLGFVRCHFFGGELIRVTRCQVCNQNVFGSEVLSCVLDRKGQIDKEGAIFTINSCFAIVVIKGRRFIHSHSEVIFCLNHSRHYSANPSSIVEMGVYQEGQKSEPRHDPSIIRILQALCSISGIIQIRTIDSSVTHFFLSQSHLGCKIQVPVGNASPVDRRAHYHRSCRSSTQDDFAAQCSLLDNFQELVERPIIVEPCPRMS